MNHQSIPIFAIPHSTFFLAPIKVFMTHNLIIPHLIHTTLFASSHQRFHFSNSMLHIVPHTFQGFYEPQHNFHFSPLPLICQPHAHQFYLHILRINKQLQHYSTYHMVNLFLHHHESSATYSPFFSSHHVIFATPPLATPPLATSLLAHHLLVLPRCVSPNFLRSYS